MKRSCTILVFSVLCVFVLCWSVHCVQCCQCLRIVHCWLSLSVFSNVYLIPLFCVALLCVFTFVAPFCDVRYDFRITPISSSFPVLCSRAHVSFMLYLFVWVHWCPMFCHIMCIYVHSSLLWCPLRFPHKNDVRFVFTSSCL